MRLPGLASPQLQLLAALKAWNAAVHFHPVALRLPCLAERAGPDGM